MNKEKEFRERCEKRGLDTASTDKAVRLVMDLETACAGPDGTLATAKLECIESHIAELVSRGAAGESEVLAFARYFSVLGIDAIVIRLLSYLLPIGVLPAMSDRLAKLEGESIRKKVITGINFPPPGARPEVYPAATRAFTIALERELGREKAHRVLAWNVHGIPPEAYAKEREAFLAAPSIESWLEGFHARKVAEIEKHAIDGTLWFEQKITPAVVDFVRRNPEILGGVRDGNRILATKIPYNPDRYLKETDPVEKRKLACHCPLAASTIKPGGADVPPLWCSCSAGYEKFIFDTVFGEETEVTVLQSALDGSEICRYAVTIPRKTLELKP